MSVKTEQEINFPEINRRSAIIWKPSFTPKPPHITTSNLAEVRVFNFKYGKENSDLPSSQGPV